MTGPGALTPGTPPTGALRVSDAEREQAVGMLQVAYAEGRIDHLELDRRIEDALASTDRADLSRALRGLPMPARTAAAPRHVPASDASPAPTGEERLWALVAHWSGLFTLFVVPALIAVSRGSTSRYVRTQAWEATNFQLTFLGSGFALAMATGMTAGLAGLLFVPLLFLWFVLMGIGGLSAACGNPWHYPWNVRILGQKD